MPFKIAEVEFIFKRELIITKSVCIKWAGWRRTAGKGERQIADEAEEMNTKWGMHREGAKLLPHKPAADGKTPILGKFTQLKPSWLPDPLPELPQPSSSHPSENGTTDRQEKEQSAILQLLPLSRGLY